MAGMNRVSYFTPIKGKEGMAVGPVSAEQLDLLLKTISDARDVGKGIVFFLFKNEPDPEKGRKSIATLTVAVERDRPQSSGGYQRRPIANTTPPKTDPMKDFLGGNTKQKGW